MQRPAAGRFFSVGMTIVLGVVVVAVDGTLPLDQAIPMVSLLALLLAVRLLPRASLLGLGMACGLLSVLGLCWVHGGAYTPMALMRCVASLCTIALATALVLRERQALATANERAVLVDRVHDAVVVRDLRKGADRIDYWNPSATAIYGWAEADAVGRSADELLRTMYALPHEAVWAALQTSGCWQGEARHYRRDGAMVRVHSRLFLQRDSEGKPSRLTVLERVLDADGIASAAAAVAGEVSQGLREGQVKALAHELCEPLTAIMIQAEAGLRWLDRESPDRHEVHAALRRVVSDAREAGRSLDRLRGLLQPPVSERSLFLLNDVVSEVLPWLRHHLEAHAVRLDLSLDRASGPVLGYRAQLLEVIRQLLADAIAAMAAQDHGARLLMIRCRRQSNRVVLEISDSGTGIEAEHRPLMFKAFFSNRDGQQGLGLSVCRHIVAEHGGRLGMEVSERGRARLVLTLPLAEPMHSPVRAPLATSQHLYGVAGDTSAHADGPRRLAS